MPPPPGARRFGVPQLPRLPRFGGSGAMPGELGPLGPEPWGPVRGAGGKKGAFSRGSLGENHVLKHETCVKTMCQYIFFVSTCVSFCEAIRGLRPLASLYIYIYIFIYV